MFVGLHKHNDAMAKLKMFPTKIILRHKFDRLS